MKTIARFEVPEEAHLFSAFLESSGISSYVWDENFVQWCWYYSNAVGGVRVVVDEPDFERSTKEYEDYTKAIVAEPRSVSVARSWPLVLVLSFFAGAPMLVFGRRHLGHGSDS